MAAAFNASMSRMSMDDNYVLVAAIDFGTTFSGYAFSFKTSKDDIKMNKNWGAEVGFESYKAPTCVLTDSNGKYKAFGYEAEKLYANSVEEDPGKQYQLYDRFKMILHKEKKYGSNTQVVSRSGNLFSADKIFAMALKFLKNHLMDALEQQGSKPDAKLIRWVLTVPAIWSDSSKQFMRRAAKMAEIIDDENSDRMVIALEPEAASLYCRHIPLHDFKDQSGRGDQGVNLPNGAKYMVIDSGGGTVDITAHEVKDGAKVRELHVASGGPWGGTQVDENFIKVLEDVLSARFVKKYRTESPTQWLAMMVDFEKKKRSVQPSDPNASINVQLAWALGSLFQQECGKAIDKAIKDAKHKGVTFSNGMICFGKECLDEIFNPVMTSIVRHVKELLRKPILKDIGYFFLVGGFSDSGYLQDAIKSSISDGRRKILIPNSAGFAVMNGAVMFGHNPQVITSRVARKTYGTDTHVPFDERKHKQDKIEMVNGVKKCKDIFSVFVRKNEEIPQFETRNFTFYPLHEDQKAVAFTLFSADTEVVEYVDDPGVIQCGKIRIEMPDTKGGTNRPIKVSVTFGGTEIHVRAVDESKAKGQVQECFINFLSD